MIDFRLGKLYSRYPIFQAVFGKLSWTHLVEIVRIENELEKVVFNSIKL